MLQALVRQDFSVGRGARLCAAEQVFEELAAFGKPPGIVAHIGFVERIKLAQCASLNAGKGRSIADLGLRDLDRAGKRFIVENTGQGEAQNGVVSRQSFCHIGASVLFKHVASVRNAEFLVLAGALGDRANHVDLSAFWRAA